MKSQAEQPLFVTLGEAGNSQKRLRRWRKGSQIQNTNSPGVLFDDKEAIRVAGRRRNEDGPAEARSHPANPDFGPDSAHKG
jgi:hypothetical protein